MRKTLFTLAVMSGVMLALVVGAGCQQAGGEPSGDGGTTAGREAGSGTEPGSGTEHAGATASAGDGASAEAGTARASAGNGGAVARSGNNEARAGDAGAGSTIAEGGEARAGDAAEEDEKGKAKAGGDGSPNDKVMLRVGGDAGTRFSGTCAVGGEEHDISGRTPERFVYDLDGGGLACELRNPDGGTLKVVVVAENRRAQMISSGGSEISFTVSENSISSSTSS